MQAKKANSAARERIGTQERRASYRPPALQAAQAIILVLIGISAIAWAGAAARAAQMDLDRFALQAPLILDAEEDARYLVAGDFDGDGHKDCAVFDSKKNLLRLFYARDLASDKPFEKEEMVVEQVVNGMSAADLNGDGKDDLLLSCDPPAAMYQKKQGKLAPAEKLDIEGAIAKAVDINGDGRADIIAFKDQMLRVAMQKKDGTFEKPREYRGVHRIAGDFEVKDMNGDGLPDIMSLNPESRDSLIVRFQDKQGGYGQERIMKTGAFDSAQISSRLGNGKPGVVMAEQKTGVVKVAQMKPETNPTKPVFSKPRLCAFDIESPSGREIVLTGDMDGSGVPEIALVSSQKAEVSVFGASEDGALSRRAAPSLQGVTQAAMVKGKKGRDELWLLSPVEESLGILSAEGKGVSAHFAFPKMLGAGVKPMAFAVGRLTPKSKGPDLVVGYRPKSEGGKEGGKDAGKSDLQLAFYPDMGVSAARLTNPTTMTLPKTEGMELTAIKAADFDNDERDDLMCFFDYQQPRILIQQKDGVFKALQVEEAAGAGMFNQLTPARVKVADVTGAGKNEILIARSSFSRALAIGKDGAISVMDQFNGKNAKSEIAAAVVANLDGGKRPQIVLLDTGNNCLTIYARDAQGAYALAKSETLDGIVARDLIACDLNKDGKDDLILVGNDRYGIIYGGVEDQIYRLVQSYITDIDEGAYSNVEVGDFSGGGKNEILALEATEHVLEFLQMKENDTLERFYRFKVFEGVERSASRRGEMMYGGGEPREMIVKDFNGDGRPDLLALCHREVLIYQSKELDKKEAEKRKAGKE